MSIDASLVGRSTPPITTSWDSKDALLYALGVGAGQVDPLDELEFTTENTRGLEQRVLPTFANTALAGGQMPLPDGIDFTKMLHAGQAVSLHGELPVTGTAEVSMIISDVFDKGSGALLILDSTAVDPVTKDVIATIRTSIFFRGYGGFGGDRGPSGGWEKPTGRPDHEVTYATRENQALIYRLTGDRNPLHTDPAFSAAGGFDRPILHGMCSYGFTGRALLHAAADSDPKRFAGMSGRFTASIVPGQTLTVAMWVDGNDGRFQTTNERGELVIDQGTFSLT